MLFWSLIKALNGMDGVSVTLINNIPHLREILAAPADHFTFLFLDQYGLDDVKAACKHFHTPNVFSAWKCRLRMMDFWGTPSNQNHEHLHQLQFIVPYPHFARLWENYFLGFLPATELMELKQYDKPCGKIQAQDSGWTFKPKPSLHQGVLYGKMDKYFIRAEGLIQAISKLVCTFPLPFLCEQYFCRYQ
jgi:hypothetical protein